MSEVPGSSGLDVERFAALLCDWCLEVQPGQGVVVDTTTAAEPIGRAMYGAILQRGGWPQVNLQLPDQERQIYERGRELHLDGDSPIRRGIVEAMDSQIRINAPVAGDELAGIDPRLVARRANATRPLRAKRLAKRWAVSLWPTPALADTAGMSLEAYTAFLGRALCLDREDPIAAWAELHDRQQQLIDRLTPARRIRIRAAGTDLTLEVSRRTWRNSDGRRNMPSGEVFTSPHEASANGHIRFDVPSRASGATVSGIELTFVDGLVTQARAEVGDARLQAALHTDAGARRLGEIGIGTNAGIDRPTGSTLLDEKIGGTVHLALGASYPECGGLNESALHWDIVCDLREEGEISVDGEVLALSERLL